MKVNGKEVTPKMDLGAMKIFKKTTGRSFLALDEKSMDEEAIAGLIYACAARGGSEITMDDVDSMSMQELVDAQGEIEQLMADFQPDKKK